MMKRMKPVIGLCAFTVASGAFAAGTGIQAEQDWPLPVHDSEVFGQILFDRMEYQRDGSDEIALWDAQAWAGKDRKRLWIEKISMFSTVIVLPPFGICKPGWAPRQPLVPALIRSVIRPSLASRGWRPIGSR